MPGSLKIFVVDTGPLITLAVAQSLDYLLCVDADVVVPDAVLHEATFDAARPRGNIPVPLSGARITATMFKLSWQPRNRDRIGCRSNSRPTRHPRPAPPS